MLNSVQDYAEFPLKKVIDLKSNLSNNLHDMVSEAGQSRTVRVNGEWVMVFKSREHYPDIINDLQELLAKQDIEDIRYLDMLLLVGSKKSVQVDSNFVKELLGDRTPSSVIINRMKDELDRDFGYKLYNRGPHKRLAIRIPIHEIADYIEEYSASIKEVILNDGYFTPDNLGDILSVYLISDETYVRIEPDIFFNEIFNVKSNAGVFPDEVTPSAEIILGESPCELLELALKKLKDYEIYRDIKFVDAAGMEYHFDAVAVSGDNKVLLKYIDPVTDEDLLCMKLYMDSLDIQDGWIMTASSRENQSIKYKHTDNISILTMQDL
jgi:hypothetical protein